MSLSSTDEEQALTHKRKGDDLLLRKNWPDAINEYTTALEKYSTNATSETIRALRSNRAAAYLELRMFDQAIPDCDFIIRQPGQPKDDLMAIKAYHHLGRSYMFLFQDKRALVALKLHKTFARAWENKNPSPPSETLFASTDDERIAQLERIVEQRAIFERRAKPASKGRKTVRYEVRVSMGRGIGDQDPLVDAGESDLVRFVFWKSAPTALTTPASQPHPQTSEFISTLILSHNPEILADLLKRFGARWRCVVCCRPASSIRHGAMSYLTQEPDSFVLDLTQSVCSKGGACDLAAEQHIRGAMVGVPEVRLP